MYKYSTRTFNPSSRSDLYTSLDDLLLQLPDLLFRLADYALRAGFCVLGYRLAVLSDLVGLRLCFRFQGCFSSAVAEGGVS